MLQSCGRSTARHDASPKSASCAPAGSPWVKRQSKSKLSRLRGSAGSAGSMNSARLSHGDTDKAATPRAVRPSKSRRVSRAAETAFVTFMRTLSLVGAARTRDSATTANEDSATVRAGKCYGIRQKSETDAYLYVESADQIYISDL